MSFRGATIANREVHDNVVYTFLKYTAGPLALALGCACIWAAISLPLTSTLGSVPGAVAIGLLVWFAIPFTLLGIIALADASSIVKIILKVIARVLSFPLGLLLPQSWTRQPVMYDLEPGTHPGTIKVIPRY